MSIGFYCESPIAGGDLKSGMPNAPAKLSWDGGASAAGRMEVYCESSIAGGDSNQVFQVRPPDFHGTVARPLPGACRFAGQAFDTHEYTLFAE